MAPVKNIDQSLSTQLKTWNICIWQHINLDKSRSWVTWPLSHWYITIGSCTGRKKKDFSNKKNVKLFDLSVGRWMSVPVGTAWGARKRLPAAPSNGSYIQTYLCLSFFVFTFFCVYLQPQAIEKFKPFLCLRNWTKSNDIFNFFLLFFRNWSKTTRRFVHK